MRQEEGLTLRRFTEESDRVRSIMRGLMIILQELLKKRMLLMLLPVRIRCDSEGHDTPLIELKIGWTLKLVFVLAPFSNQRNYFLKPQNDVKITPHLQVS